MTPNTSRLQAEPKFSAQGHSQCHTGGGGGACSEFQATPLQMEAELAEKLALGEADVNPV